MTLSRTVSAERCGQQPDCSGSTGEVTFEPGSEWQVRKWSGSWEPCLGGGGKLVGSSHRRKGGSGRPPGCKRLEWVHGLPGERCRLHADERGDCRRALL